MKRVILLCVSLLLWNGLMAQDYTKRLEDKRNEKNYGFSNVIDFKYHHGQFMKNTESLDDIMDNPYDAIDARIGFQANGKNHMMDQLYGFPVYGFGFYKAFFEGGELGSPNAFYMFMRAPILRGKRLTWNWELAVGLAYGFTPYNPETNPDQQVIGSEQNVYFNAATGLSYELSDRIDLTFDLDLSHMSNGSTRTPNLGINLMGLAIGGRYNFNPVKNYTKSLDGDYIPASRPAFIKRDIPKFLRHSEIILFGSIGGKTTTTQPYDGPTYFVSSVSVDYAWCYHHVGKLGVGFDGFYESALRDFPEKLEDPTFADLSYAGFHIAHYLKIYRLTFVTQIGFNLSNHVDHKGKNYFQVGGSFDINDRLFARAALKTRNGAVADFIEWGMGYRIPFAYGKQR